MKFGVLKSIGHNIADSLASGVGYPVGIYMTDIFKEAANLEASYITVDFLTGQPLESGASQALIGAIIEYQKFLPDLCEKHGTPLEAFRVLTACFGTHPVYGKLFTVTVEDQKGRRSVDQYEGIRGTRLKRGH